VADEIQKHGLSGYRKGCKCETCRRGKREAMREYRARKKREAAAVAGETEAVAETARDLDPLAPVPALDPHAAAGTIEQALAQDLDELSGEPPWKRTLSAVARLNARMLDQAPRIDRLDLVSPIELRLVEQLKLLRGVSVGGGSLAADAEQLLRDMAGEE
jgi:hypothetical protein